MTTVEEKPDLELCRSCEDATFAKFEIQIKRTPTAQMKNRFTLCLKCLDELREAISKIIPF